MREAIRHSSAEPGGLSPSDDLAKELAGQDRRIGELLCGYDAATRSDVNETEHLVVEKVSADDYGGATIHLSGGYRIVMFPMGTRGEDWRLFRPGEDELHFLISGGQIEQ